jgi:hypothetical protein
MPIGVRDYRKELKNTPLKKESVNHPEHYQQIPGIEVIDVVEHLNFNKGNAIKYILRAEHKGNEIEDLQKAKWYLEREIARLQK